MGGRESRCRQEMFFFYQSWHLLLTFIIYGFPQRKRF